MKKELEYFTIENSFGGNQDWFTNIVMNIGGCAAATACDCCIYFAMQRGMEVLYPLDIHNLTKGDYKKFSQMMKPYIRPRAGGVKKLEWFIDGFQKYIHDVNEANADRISEKIQIDMKPFPGDKSLQEAKEFIKTQINREIPIPCLLLKHKNTELFKDYIWHWFLIVGYEETENDLLIKTATYGEAVEFSLSEMWDTGYEEKGGLVQLGTRHI